MAHRILLVQSRKELSKNLEAAFGAAASSEFVIEEAASGEEALLVASGIHVDLLVVDYRLPGFGGLELLHRMRSHDPKLNVIVTYGKADADVREKILSAGAAAALQLPVDAHELIEVVQDLLGLQVSQTPGMQAPPLPGPPRIADLLANFRQDNHVLAVLLLDEAGRVLARAGDLPALADEAPFQHALGEMYRATCRAAALLSTPSPEARAVLHGQNLDLLLASITTSHALVLAGPDLWQGEHRGELDTAVTLLCVALAEALDSMSAELGSGTPIVAGEAPAKAAAPPDAAIEGLLRSEPALSGEALDAYWDRASAQHASEFSQEKGLDLEEARRLGLAPGGDDN